MNLHPVTGQAFGTQCCACHKHVIGGDQAYKSRVMPGRLCTPDDVFADLDGKPFEAYYCADCAQQIHADLPGPWSTPDDLIRQVSKLRAVLQIFGRH